jgi:hypothetical protein
MFHVKHCRHNFAGKGFIVDFAALERGKFRALRKS